MKSPLSLETVGMSPELYKAAMIGDIGKIREYKHELERQFTPTKNSLLHVLAQFTDSGECVKEILNFGDDNILLWVNAKGETALHMAARNGRIRIVNAILERSKVINKGDIERGGEDDTLTLTKQMLRMQNKVGDTALHEAIKFNHKDVGELLFKEDPEFLYPSNDMKETPLYLAAEKGSCRLVELMCESATPSYDGPRNMTALHAAIIHNCAGCTRVLLEKLPILTKKADASGWTALHLAARRKLVARIEQLLEADPSLAYITASQDNGKTALHVATARGRVTAMEEILKHSPDCWEINTCDDRNLLHIAVDCGRLKATNFLIGEPWAAHLTNGKDANGDTPLHLYAISSYASVPNILEHAAEVNPYNKEHFTPIDMLRNSDVCSNYEGIISSKLKEMGARPGRRNIAATDNKRYRTLKDMKQQYKKIMPLDPKKMTETHMIVATLIATVTFAAAFALPGGYDGNAGPNQGMAVLTRNIAFQGFIISNAIALMFSIIAVFLLLYTVMTDTAYGGRMLRCTASFLLRSSVVEMLIAFTAGSYSVLDSKVLQITICILGGIAIIFFYLLVGKESRIIPVWMTKMYFGVIERRVLRGGREIDNIS